MRSPQSLRGPRWATLRLVSTVYVFTCHRGGEVRWPPCEERVPDSLVDVSSGWSARTFPALPREAYVVCSDGTAEIKGGGKDVLKTGMTSSTSRYNGVAVSSSTIHIGLKQDYSIGTVV